MNPYKMYIVMYQQVQFKVLLSKKIVFSVVHDYIKRSGNICIWNIYMILKLSLIISNKEMNKKISNFEGFPLKTSQFVTCVKTENPIYV